MAWNGGLVVFLLWRYNTPCLYHHAGMNDLDMNLEYSGDFLPD